MNNKKSEWGVVVLLRKDHLILLTSDVHRSTAARMMWEAKKVHRPMKFFPVKAGTAADTIRKINQSGILGARMDQPPAAPRWQLNWRQISSFPSAAGMGTRLRVRL